MGGEYQYCPGKYQNAWADPSQVYVSSNSIGRTGEGEPGGADILGVALHRVAQLQILAPVPRHLVRAALQALPPRPPAPTRSMFLSHFHTYCDHAVW